jgi:hypothetical protein
VGVVSVSAGGDDDVVGSGSSSDVVVGVAELEDAVVLVEEELVLVWGEVVEEEEVDADGVGVMEVEGSVGVVVVSVGGLQAALQYLQALSEERIHTQRQKSLSKLI